MGERDVESTISPLRSPGPNLEGSQHWKMNSEPKSIKHASALSSASAPPTRPHSPPHSGRAIPPKTRVRLGKAQAQDRFSCYSSWTAKDWFGLSTFSVGQELPCGLPEGLGPVSRTGHPFPARGDPLRPHSRAAERTDTTIPVVRSLVENFQKVPGWISGGMSRRRRLGSAL